MTAAVFEPYGPPQPSMAATVRALDNKLDEATVLRRDNHRLRGEKANLQACLEAERAEAARLRRENQAVCAERGQLAAGAALITEALAAAAGFYDCPCGSAFECGEDLEDYAALNRWLGWHFNGCPSLKAIRENASAAETERPVATGNTAPSVAGRPASEPITPTMDSRSDAGPPTFTTGELEDAAHAVRRHIDERIAPTSPIGAEAWTHLAEKLETAAATTRRSRVR